MDAHHPILDAARFLREFPLGALRAEATHNPNLAPRGHIVTSPFHISVIEQLREEAGCDTATWPGQPTDGFVFAEGAPPAPFLTKIGGLPFRSKAKAWPRTEDGRAMGFVGQLCFLDSLDLVPTQIGSVLLIFVDPERQLVPAAYACEWVRLDEVDLVTPVDVPPSFFTRSPGRLAASHGAVPERRLFAPFECHGVRHRTRDVSGADSLFLKYRHGDRLGVLEATKIGGLVRGDTGPRTGRFLGSLASVLPAPDVTFPWVNSKSPISMRDRHRLSTWMLGDMGTLSIVEVDGAVHCLTSTY